MSNPPVSRGNAGRYPAGTVKRDASSVASEKSSSVILAVGWAASLELRSNGAVLARGVREN